MVNINALIVINVHWFCTFVFCRTLLETEAKVTQKKQNGRGRLVADRNGLCSTGFGGIAQIWGSGRQMLPPVPFVSKCSAVFVWHPPPPPQVTPWEYHGGVDWCHLRVFNMCIWSYMILMSLRFTSSAPKEQDCKTCFIFGVKSPAILLHSHNPVLWPLLTKICFWTWI